MNKQNIVYLDAFTLNPGDLSFKGLEDLGNFQAYERTSSDELEERAKHADILIVNKFVVNEEVLKLIPNLKYIVVSATGFNNIDVAAVKNRNIPVSNIKAYGSNSVAQHVFSVVLTILNKPTYYDVQVKESRWSKSEDFCFYDHSIMDLNGMNLGIMGYGEIGRKVAEIGHVFGMDIMVHTPRIPDDRPKHINFVALDELFTTADILSLHCPLNENTNKIINKHNLLSMKPNCILVNTGRGGLIDEGALFYALDHDVIGAAALDVLQDEPPHYANPLMMHQKVLMTPHIAWASKNARTNLLNGIVNNITSFQQNKMVNLIY